MIKYGIGRLFHSSLVPSLSAHPFPLFLSVYFDQFPFPVVYILFARELLQFPFWDSKISGHKKGKGIA
jgi:hypothetical protein